MQLLQRDAELQEVVQLVGPDALQDSERLVLEISKMIREIFLQQNAFSDNDAFSSLEKTAGLLDALLAFHDACREKLENGVTLARILDLPVREDLARLRDVPGEAFMKRRHEVVEAMKTALAELTPKG